MLRAGLIFVVAGLAAGAPAPGNSSCLTPKQDAQLKEAVTAIHDTLATAVVSLDIAAAAEKDPKTKADLQLAAKVCSAVNKEIVANLTKIAEAPCGTCTQVVAIVDASIEAIKEAIEKVEPNWQNDPIWKAVFTAIDAILGIVKDVCPSTAPAPRPLLPGVTLAAGDDCTYTTQSACDANSTCTWCKCSAVPSACWTKKDASGLPPGVYTCDK